MAPLPPTPNTATLVHHSGAISFDDITRLLAQIEASPEIGELSVTQYKRLYGAAVELLENIIMHGYQGEGMRQPEFRVSRSGNVFAVEGANTVLADEGRKLTERINYMNNNRELLQKIYNQSLKTNKLSEKGGAGLGLIIVSKGANSAVDSTVEPIDNRLAYFRISVSFKSERRRRPTVSKKNTDQ